MIPALIGLRAAIDQAIATLTPVEPVLEAWGEPAPDRRPHGGAPGPTEGASGAVQGPADGHRYPPLPGMRPAVHAQAGRPASAVLRR
jgi:hypothetical protein